MASTDELWLTDLGDPHPGEPSAHRPALVLGPPASFGSQAPFVILAPLTTRHRGLSLHVEVDPAPPTGLHELSWVQCELIRSVSRRRLVQRLGHVDLETSDRVGRIVRTLLGY